jgi:hypothetical protein
MHVNQRSVDHNYIALTQSTSLEISIWPHVLEGNRRFCSLQWNYLLGPYNFCVSNQKKNQIN